MASPGWKFGTLLWCWMMCLTSAEVTMKGIWKENTGWEVKCSWQTWMNDSLQSVRMFKNDFQFFVFRPETAGTVESHNTFNSADFSINVECKLANPQGQRGTCVNKIIVYENATEDTYTCEVSGERPLFRQERKNYTVFVPPSNAVIVPIQTLHSDHRKILNCTSSGLPAPKLVWTVNGSKQEGDFSRTTWNRTTKLWHSWSSLNLQDDSVTPVCTPEVTTKSGAVERGWQARYKDNSATLHDVSKVILAVTLILSLSR